MDLRPVLQFGREFLGFLRERKKFWLLPLVLVLVLMGLLVYFTLGSSVAPHLYTTF